MVLRVECRGLGVEYQLRREGEGRWRAGLWGLVSGAPRESFWGLRGLDLEVADGEILGVVGANGAGKSTLCQVLAGILHPDEGEVTTRGRVTSLLGVGIGFHDELTGWDNLLRAGAFLGFKRRDMEARREAIVGFAELEGFMDVPLGQWSSGMRARLGFALGLETRGEILILDEVLAVGDEGFREKCHARLRELLAEARAIIMVSHDCERLTRLATRALWLERGQARLEGPPAEVVGAYLASMRGG